MTHRSADKAAARALADLTRAPYQSCLTTIGVLRRIPEPRDLGILDPILRGRPGAHIEVPLTERDINDLRLLTSQGTWIGVDDVAVLHCHESDYTQAYVELSLPGLDVPSNCRVILDVFLDG